MISVCTHIVYGDCELVTLYIIINCTEVQSIADLDLDIELVDYSTFLVRPHASYNVQFGDSCHGMTAQWKSQLSVLAVKWTIILSDYDDLQRTILLEEEASIAIKIRILTTGEKNYMRL